MNDGTAIQDLIKKLESYEYQIKSLNNIIEDYKIKLTYHI
jgi:hypothetical protein